MSISRQTEEGNRRGIISAMRRQNLVIRFVRWTQKNISTFKIQKKAHTKQCLERLIITDVPHGYSPKWDFIYQYILERQECDAASNNCPNITSKLVPL